MIKIPIKPISINECWQGRRFKTNRYNNWRINFSCLLNGQKKYLSKNLKVKIFLYLKSITRSDIDNFLKPIIDSLVKDKIIVDDRFIQELEVKKIKSIQEYIEYEIIEEKKEILK